MTDPKYAAYSKKNYRNRNLNELGETPSSFFINIICNYLRNKKLTFPAEYLFQTDLRQTATDKFSQTFTQKSVSRNLTDNKIKRLGNYSRVILRVGCKRINSSVFVIKGKLV